MIGIRGFIVVLVLIGLGGCSSQKEKDQTINISGAFALYPLVVQWAEAYQKENPEIRFNISGGGAGKGLADALAGVVDLGMFSREITPEEKAKGTWWVGLTIDAVIPSISSQNPYLAALKQRGVTREEFKAIFVDGTITNWNQLIPGVPSTAINIYTRSDACGAAETFAKYLGANQEDLQGIGIFGDPGLAEVVVKDPLGIGYNNTIYVYDVKTGKKREGAEVIPIDINGNGKVDAEEEVYETFPAILGAIAQGVYPSPPARELYFVANGKPQKKAVIDFIRWTLTEGQKYVQEAGYVPLEPKIIEEYLKTLQ
jgi:phosphate transport system substrate-binding protein